MASTEFVFRKAAEQATHADFPQASSDVKLQLYGLFKQATKGSCSSTSRPGVMDQVGRAKYDAWAKCSQLSKAGARARYVALVRSVDPSFMVGEEAQPAASPTSPPTPVQGERVATTHGNNDLAAAVRSGVLVVDVDVPKYTDLEDDQGFRYTIYNIRVALSDGKIWTVGRRYTEVRNQRSRERQRHEQGKGPVWHNPRYYLRCSF